MQNIGNTLSSNRSLDQMAAQKNSKVDQFRLTKNEIKDFDKLSFNIFEFKKTLKGEKVLAYMSMYSMSKMGLLNNGKESELSLDRKNVRKFLDTVADDYNNEIPYHNQMHAADVMHMSYLMMT